MKSWMVPVALAVVIGAVPIVRYVGRTEAESRGADFLTRLQAAQKSFRAGGGRGGYASSLESLTSPCEGSTAALSSDDVRTVAQAGFDVTVRLATSGETRGTDCHGRPTVTNYYAALRPRSTAVLPQRAFAVTGNSGSVFVFFDGIPPREDDMRPGGLATPVERLDTFKIP